MIYALISLSYIIGGLFLLRSSKLKYKIYLSTGFILLGIYYVLKTSLLQIATVQLVFMTPLVLAVILFVISPALFLKEGGKHG